MGVTKSSKAAVLSYTIGEEIANSILHGVGTLGAVAALVLLNLKTRGVLGGPRGSGMDVAAVTIYAVAMIGMFLTSTLYHAIRHGGAKRIFRIFDHSGIYLFIAGTYTPFCLIALRGVWGWSLFAFEWTMAALGITLYATGNKALKKIEVAVYILMGWAIVAGFVPLVRSIPVSSIIFLLAGGVVYTMGTIWYRKKHIRGTHIVWHAFVLLGAIFQWVSIWLIL